MMRRQMLLLAIAVALPGCSEFSDEPRPLPDPVGERREVRLPDDRIRVWPRSASVEPEVAYEMDAYTHCGLEHLLDFDGSFWAVEAGPEPDSLNDPLDQGLIRLVDENDAVYTSSQGGEFQLVRREGPKDIHMCE